MFFSHGQPREDRVLLEDHAAVVVRAGDRLAVDVDAARVGGEEAGRHVEQRRLAAAAGAEHAHELAGAHVEGDAVEHLEALLAAAEAEVDVLELDLSIAGVLSSRGSPCLPPRVSSAAHPLLPADRAGHDEGDERSMTRAHRPIRTTPA